MAISVKELRLWLEGFTEEQAVSIDEGGLILQETGNRSHYLEVGGDPEEDTTPATPLINSRFYLPYMTDEDDKPILFDGFTAGEEWNGWSCPQFTKEQADIFLGIYNEFAQADGTPAGRFDEGMNAYVFPNINTDEDDIFDESIENGVSYYHLGSHAWAWIEEEEHVCDDDCRSNGCSNRFNY